MIGKRMGTGVLTAAVALLACTAANAVTHEWTNAAGDQNLENTNNWVVGGVVVTNLPGQGDVARFNLDGTNTAIIVADFPVGGENMNAVQLGYVGGQTGAVHQTAGTLKTTAASSGNSRLGYIANAVGIYTQDGGTHQANGLRLGAATGTGIYILNDGLLRIDRAPAASLLLDAGGTGSTGIFEINGGQFRTRANVIINDGGTFRVKGAGATQIGIGSQGAIDGFWDQRPSGTLEVQVASDGLSKILVDYVDGTGGGGAFLGNADFDAGSILDVSFMDGHLETNAWIVMETEGSIIDNGLTLSADPGWAFGITNNPVDEVDVLWVGYGGAEYIPPEPPPTGTNVFVDAIVPMAAETWNLTVGDVQNGNTSALSDQSSSGFTAYFDEVVEDPALGYRPVVAQEFESVKDLSEIGQSVTVNFDVVLLNTPASRDKDFRPAFYDTAGNCSWYTGIDLGQLGSMNTRMMNAISAQDQTQFVPGDYGLLGLGYSTLTANASGNPTPGLNQIGVTNHIEMSLSRIGTNEVQLSTIWTAQGSVTTGTLVCVVDESAPDYPEYMPADGKWDRVDGFGIMIFDSTPFAPASGGSFRVSNFEVSSVQPLAEGFSYSISDVDLVPSGDAVLALSDAIVGATYKVMASDNLVHSSMQEVGSYVADASGVITIPAADLAPYVGDAGFIDVELPVTFVIE